MTVTPAIAPRPRARTPRVLCNAAWYAQFNRRARIARKLRNNAAPPRAA